MLLASVTALIMPHKRQIEVESCCLLNIWRQQKLQLPVECTVGTGDGARIDVELVLVFKCVEPMSVSRNKNVNVELSLNHRKALCVAPRYHLMTVAESDAKVSDRHHLLLRVIQILYTARTVLSQP